MSNVREIMKKSYAVLLPKTLPEELHAFLKDYLFLFHEQNFLLCYSFENLGNYFEADILQNNKSKKTWKVQLQIQYALAIAEANDSENNPIGFLS